MKRYKDDLDKDMKWHRKNPQDYLKYAIAILVLTGQILYCVSSYLQTAE